MFELAALWACAFTDLCSAPSVCPQTSLKPWSPPGCGSAPKQVLVIVATPSRTWDCMVGVFAIAVCAGTYGSPREPCAPRHS